MTFLTHKKGGSLKMGSEKGKNHIDLRSGDHNEHFVVIIITIVFFHFQTK